jgi:hypothetical protein
MMNITDNAAASREAALDDTELLCLLQQQPTQFPKTGGASQRQTPLPARMTVKHFPYARLDQTTIRRAKRLGPAFSPLTTRHVYPAEDTAATDRA